ncbi:MAG: hypothetical protein NTY90_02510 [Candidatus Micrarchaeota archaeon]|nr:hypothetical protein [Candidatus Micrarchaeota archaeon]
MQMANVTLNLLYNELKCLHKDVEILKSAVIPVEKISAAEKHELDRLSAEMKRGKKHSMAEVFGTR